MTDPQRAQRTLLPAVVLTPLLLAGMTGMTRAQQAALPQQPQLAAPARLGVPDATAPLKALPGRWTGTASPSLPTAIASRSRAWSRTSMTPRNRNCGRACAAKARTSR